MSKIRAALIAMIALATSTAVADQLRVVTLTELHEPGQLAHLKEVDGDCRYYGSVERTTIRVEVSVCSTEDGTPVEAPFPGVASIGGLPVPAGTLIDLAKK